VYLSGKKLEMVVAWRACHPSYGWKYKMEASLSRLAWAKKGDSISKMAIVKRAGGVVQEVD
jgi:hypothetical protein